MSHQTGPPAPAPQRAPHLPAARTATRTARTTHTTHTTRTVLRLAPLAACVPYLSLKTAWLAGSRIGIPEGSALRRDGNSLMALNGDELLAPRVWSIVYTGFVVQGLALGTLLVLYARERWGPLWRGRLGALPPGPARSARRLTAAAAAVASLLPAAVHLLWAVGGTTGLHPARAAAVDLDARLNDAGYVLFAVLTAAGAATLAYGRGCRVPVLLPLTTAWIGSGVLACWGGWMTLTTLTATATATDPKLRTPLMSLTYAVQMIVGTMVVVAGAHFFAEREAARCD
ncbi:hypothetical protein ACFVJH_18065 [Streptomyces decoyicus]|uniref:hypothetical protein n=1 Tax=Streptomyces decoyicus TaxID=249567 RepID=UPI003642EBC8